MASPRFTLARLILLGSAALALIAICIYVALPMLLGAWLQHLLTAQDFTHVRLELGRPGLHRLRLQHLEMTRQLGDQSLVFNARNLDLEYRLLDILKGRVRSLRIPEARLDMQPSPTAPNALPQAFALPVPAHWTRAFPLQELIVEKFDIHWHAGDSEIRHARLQGQAHQAEGTLRSRWSLQTRDRVEFELDIDAQGRLSSALYKSAAPTEALFRADVTVTPQANELVAVQGSLETKFKPLAALLDPWLPKALRPIEGELRAAWRGEAPARMTDGIGFNGNLSLDISALRLGTRLRAGTLHLQAALARNADSWQWRLHERSRFSAQLDPALLAVGDGAIDEGFVRGTKPLVIHAPQGLAGEFALTPAEWRLGLAPGKLIIEQIHTPDARIARLNLTLLSKSQIRYRPEPSQWTSDGLHLLFTAARIQPQLAAFGDIEGLVLSTRIAAGSLHQLPALRIESTQMSMLGGQVRGRNLHYDRARAANDFTLDITGLDLARVVALEQQQQIEASGTLDGRLPFVITQTGMRIVDGELHATAAGGVIRYRANESIQSMAAANPNLKLALQAFSNYHYRKLDVGVNYAENGDLALAVAVTGRNPDWNAGQPINLNINIAENIPMLLRSLRSGDDIGRQFQNRANERSSPKP